MPKRWRVLYTGDAHAAVSSEDSDALRDAGKLSNDYAEIVADTLQVSGGALVFSTGDTVEYVFAPGSYWVVVRVPPRDEA